MAIIRVKTDCRTIGEAVRAASPGDIILLQRGVYRETVTVNKNNLSIKGEGPAIIDGEFSRDFGVILEGETGVALESIQIINCNKNGLWIKGGSSHSITCCHTDCCDDSGIKIVGAEGVRLLSSAGGGNGQSGVELVKCGDILLDHCTLNSNAFCGVEGRQTYGITEIVGCELRLNITMGCSFEGGFPVRLAGNCITDNLTDGCCLTNPLSELFGNMVSGNRGHGILSRGRGSTFRENQIANQGETGLSVTDGCLVESNRITDNGGYGLLITGRDNLIKTNIFLENREADIRRLSPRNRFIDNNFNTSLPYELKRWQDCPDQSPL